MTGAVRKARARTVPPLRGLLPLAAVLVIWELVQRGPSVYAPPPSQWWQAMRDLWSRGTLGDALGATLATFAISLVVATAAGTALGMLIGRSASVDRMLGPLLEFCRVLPVAVVVPLAVLFAGYTEKMKVAVVVFTAIWPVLLQVRAAARGLDPILLDVARALHLSRPAALRKVLFPSILPAVLSGVRVAAPVVLIIVLLVEIVTRVNGVGGLIEEAQQNFQSARVYGLVTIAGLLALAVNMAVSALEAYLLRYRPPR